MGDVGHIIMLLLDSNFNVVDQVAATDQRNGLFNYSCPISKQLVKHINSQSELNQLLKSQAGNFTPNSATNIEVDYHTQTLVVFALGQKPTAGYSLHLFKKKATLRGQKLYLPMRALEPDKN